MRMRLSSEILKIQFNVGDLSKEGVVTSSPCQLMSNPPAAFDSSITIRAIAVATNPVRTAAPNILLKNRMTWPNPLVTPPELEYDLAFFLKLFATVEASFFTRLATPLASFLTLSTMSFTVVASPYILYLSCGEVASGSTAHNIIYMNIGRPANTTRRMVMTRIRLVSIPKYAASPEHTPPRTRSFGSLKSFLLVFADEV